MNMCNGHNHDHDDNDVIILILLGFHLHFWEWWLLLYGAIAFMCCSDGGKLIQLHIALLFWTMSYRYVVKKNICEKYISIFAR